MDSLLKCHIGKGHALRIAAGPMVGTMLDAYTTSTVAAVSKSLAPIIATSVNNGVFQMHLRVANAIHDVNSIVSKEGVQYLEGSGVVKLETIVRILVDLEVIPDSTRIFSGTGRMPALMQEMKF